jgi:regulator of protease activity HflC (stomatin/prohibitin superfamily)
MTEAFAWIQWIAEWIGQFIPHFLHVDSLHGGVKFVRGRPGKSMAPGLHVYWPLTTHFHTYPIVRQAEELRGQTIVTTDDKVILVGGLIVYEVENLEKLIAHVFQPEQTVKDLTLTAVHDVVCNMSWEELKQGQRRGTLDTKLKNDARAALEVYGIKVLKVSLTDLAPCRVLKLVTTTAKGED